MSGLLLCSCQFKDLFKQSELFDIPDFKLLAAKYTHKNNIAADTNSYKFINIRFDVPALAIYILQN